MTLVRRIVDVDSPTLNAWDKPEPPDWRWVCDSDGIALECLVPRCSMFGRWLPVRTEDGTVYAGRLGGAPFPLREDTYR